MAQKYEPEDEEKRARRPKNLSRTTRATNSKKFTGWYNPQSDDRKGEWEHTGVTMKSVGKCKHLRRRSARLQDRLAHYPHNDTAYKKPGSMSGRK